MSFPTLTELIPILQIAIGPVILISGVGLLLLSMTNRLGRAIDRARILRQELRAGVSGDEARTRGDSRSCGTEPITFGKRYYCPHLGGLKPSPSGDSFSRACGKLPVWTTAMGPTRCSWSTCTSCG